MSSRFAIAVLVVLAAVNASAATVVIPPTVFAGPEDPDGNGSFTQFFNIPFTNEVSVERNGPPNVDRRAIFEFNLNMIPPGATIITATLQYTVVTANTGPGPTIALLGYTGDGVASLSDATIGSTIQSPLPLVETPQSLIVTAFVQSLYGSAQWAGFNVQDTNPSVDGRYAISSTAPINLSVTYTFPPTITLVRPTTAPTTGAVGVTISGSNFVPGSTTFTFGPNVAPPSSCTATLCTVSSPAGSGTVSIRATTSIGTSADTPADDFTYVASPATFCTTFTPPANFAVGASPRGVVISEFNGDTLPDLVNVNQGANTVSLRLGTGGGLFGAPATIPVGNLPTSVAVGNFNGDSFRDLAVTNQSSNDVTILLGNGPGTFAAPSSVPIVSGPIAVTVSDFNGDGKTDLAVAKDGASSVAILLGNGNGTFQPPTSQAVGANPHSVVANDFNADGNADLVVANAASNTVSILLGNGNGGFAAQTTFGTGTQPDTVAVGDLNGDGVSDLAVTNFVSNNVSVLLGNGSGGFGAAVNFGVGTGPISVAINDLNADGILDLVVANRTSNDMSLLPGNGNGTFQLAPAFIAGAGPTTVAIADLNGDNRLDLAVANFNSNDLSVLLNAGCPPPAVASISRSTGPAAGGTPVGITGSGFKPGVTSVLFGPNAAGGVACSPTQCTAVAPPGSGTVSVRVTTPAGSSIDSRADDFSYTAPPVTSCAAFTAAANVATATNPRELAVGDFNNDGIKDLAVPNYGSNNVSILIGSGSGTFSLSSNVAVGANPFAVAVSDFNADGNSDLAVANYNGNDATILLGTGSGAFTLASSPLAGTSPLSVAVGDFNGDGKADLVFANTAANALTFLKGNGNGTFVPPVTLGAGTAPQYVAVGDFNNDGKADIAAANFGSNNVSVLLGNGTGSFPAPVNYAAGTNPRSVAVGDFNGDNFADLAVANEASNNLSVLLGSGTGTFSAPTNFTAGSGPYGVVTGDFNSDSILDLAASNTVSNDVSLLLGVGNGTFAAATSFAVGTLPYSLVANHFDGNGRTDLAVANHNSNNVSIRLNSTNPGVLALSSASYSLGEGAGLATLFVTRSGGTDCSVTVNYSTANGTAVAGSDYTATSGTLTIPSGAASASFTVPITDDATFENSETFTVTLSVPTGGATLGAPASATVTITNNDPAPTLAINNVAQAEGNSGSTGFVFTVTLSGSTAVAVAVDYFTTNGTAIAGTDYTAASGTLTFAPGITTRTITVNVGGDTTNEPNQTFTVNLFSPLNATIATAAGLGTIQNDDPVPTLAINSLALPEGNSGTTNFVFTVTLTGATEQTVTASYATSNVTATAGGDYTAASGTLTFVPPQTTATITVPVNGDVLNEPDETFAVTLSAPTNATITTATGTGTIQNDDPLPTLAINSVSQVEGNSGTTNFALTVTLTGPTEQTVTVNYATASGTAAAGTDFTASSGTLTFAPGQTTQTILVPVNGDLTNETNETFAVSLSAPTNATITTATGTATIQNDDPVPTLAINSVTQVEGNSGTTNAIFTVTLTGATEQTVTAAYTTSNGTALSGVDYAAASGSVTFVPQQTTQTITVPVNGDAVNEADETFAVTISAPTNATITTATGTGTIQNDDPLPTLAINSVSQVEGNSGTTNFAFTVTLTGLTAQTVTVNYATANATATAGTDYTATSGSLTFAPGQTSQTILVAVNGDSGFETNETFTVNLTAPVNAIITGGSGTGTIQNDDTAFADLALTGGSSTASVGNPITYTFTIQNLGPDTANGVTLTTTLPAGQSFASASGASCSGTTSLTCSAGAISAGLSVTVGITTNTTAGGTYTVPASVTASEIDPNAANNSASATGSVGGATMLMVTSTANAGNGTLRQAILDANSGVCTPCTIGFSITPSTIPLLTALPVITANSLKIDGLTQPGVIVDGGTCACPNPFTISASGVIIQALTTRNFSGAGFALTAGGLQQQTTAATPTGYVVLSGTGNIFFNNTLQYPDGIDLGGDGPTASDAGDSDTGANNLQNNPVLNAAVVNGATVTLTLSSDSSAVPATASLLLEVFEVTGSAAAPFYSTCIAGNSLVNGTLMISTTSIVPGDLLAATVTSYGTAGCSNPGDGTSELSAAIVATGCATPTPTITASGPTTFCSGGSVTLSAPAGYTYQWSNGATTQSITVSASGSFTVTVFDIAACSATSAPVTVTVNPIPAATITASGPTTFCAGGSVTLTASSGGSWLWSNGATTSTITVSAGGNYTVTVTSTAGCSATSAPITVTVNPVPTVTISGPSVSCETGGAVTLTASGTNISSYLWSTGATTPSITVSPSTTTTYALAVSSAAGCTTSTSFTVSVNAAAALTILAPANVVSGGTGSASVAGASTGAFTWSILNGTIVSGQGTPGITFQAGPSGSVTLSVSTPSGTCTASGSTLVPILACASAPPTLTSPADGAGGLDSPVTLAWTAVSGATGYEVYVSQNNGADSLVANTGALTTVATLPSGTFSWYVIARQPQGCTTLLKSATRTFTIKPVINCPAGAPNGLSPSGGARVFSPVTLRWNGTDGATGYHVILTRAGGAVDDLGITAKDKTSVLAPVVAGDYTWQVFALYSGCPEVNSAPALFTVDAEDCSTHTAAVLVAPGQNTTAASASVDFAWQSVQGADGYRVWTSVNNGEFKAVGETADLRLAATIDNGRIEWFVETLFEGCASTESAHRFFTVPAANNCNNTQPPALISPSAGITTSASRVTFSWSPVGALQYELYIAVGNGTPILATRTADTSFTTEVPRGGIDWYVTALFNGCPSRTSESRRFTYEPPVQCTSTAPQLIAPLDDTSPIPSPVSFRWSSVPGAVSYRLSVNTGGTPLVFTTPNTSLENVTVASGVGAWAVEAIFDSSCPVTTSSAHTLVVVPPSTLCGEIGPITLAGPSQISSNVPYSIVWRTDRNSTDYTLHESTNGTFGDGSQNTTVGNVAMFTHTNATAQPVTYFYRVRGVNTRCTPSQNGPWSETVAVVVLPQSGSLNDPAETSALISQTQKIQYAIPLGPEFAGQSFTATPTREWITVTPVSGVVPAGGTQLNVVADAGTLPLGTSNGGVLITFSGSALKGQATHAGSTVTTPVNVSLVTPVVPNPKSTPPPDALIIPAVAHADGINSKFESDVRITNTSPQVMRYQLTFTPTGETGITQGRQTTIDIEPGRTVAMDDILQTWFASGSTSTLGTLEIRPLTKSSNATSSAAVKGLGNFVTFASSRTYNVTPNGTFGQHIPAIPFANFIGRANDPTKSPVLSLQQIAQSSSFRTNLGFVEGSGQPANLLVTVFGDKGEKMTDFQVALTGGQHLQMGSVLAQKGLQVNDGRIEVRVLSSGGKVTAYASVLDNKTSDSLLVTPVTLGDAGFAKYVLPGVAELSGGIPWQTDMRLFNTSSETVTATLTLQPLNGPEPMTTEITLAPNEVRQLDRVLMTLFGVTNDGGALHITTPKATNLIATARTYRPDASGGTFGQFISATTPNDAIALGSRPLQILQVEQSDRYRSNIGVAEVNGKPALVEITALPPDSKLSVSVQIPMAANQFRQLNSVLAQMGLADTFNARVTVKVIQGDGRVTAYASVVDNKTADPTFVPAQ